MTASCVLTVNRVISMSTSFARQSLALVDFMGLWVFFSGTEKLRIICSLKLVYFIQNIKGEVGRYYLRVLCLFSLCPEISEMAQH